MQVALVVIQILILDLHVLIPLIDYVLKILHSAVHPLQVEIDFAHPRSVILVDEV